MRSGELLLASRSPRRLELLASAGIDARVYPVDIDESPLLDEEPQVMALRLARAKAKAAAAETSSPSWVLAADTVVALGSRSLGKPRDDSDALDMLRRLNGRTHEVHTGVCLLCTAMDKQVGGVVTSRVRFAQWGEETLRRYVQTGEGRDKAGAYGIQGRAAALIDGIEGSVTNVIGLPMAQTLQWLSQVGGPKPFPGLGS